MNIHLPTYVYIYIYIYRERETYIYVYIYIYTYHVNARLRRGSEPDDAQPRRGRGHYRARRPG